MHSGLRWVRLKFLILFTETPATATAGIQFETTHVHEKYPPVIKITWDRYNLTTNLVAGVRISLWGYRETTIKPELEYIDLIEVRISALLLFLR